ncbi:YceI family protein [Pseudoxanthomonas sp.]|uniref:YceI family protein n=1 Tax=Pseudoxanthomonas sp. TaxID=1871049 RepID=UPI00260298CF|nr:YceI family protein [Pseudoxanthomonas sp.]WDS34879.1 MAG: YceI family protein [Pseudoxanthomonas sp.]
MAVSFKNLIRACASVGLTLCAAAAAQSRAMPLDKQHTRLGFELSTRWGQTLEGQFPRYDGVVNVLPDGRHQVSLRMYTADVQIADHERYAKWARGSAFFDSKRWPEVVFVSHPYDAATLIGGGQIAGELVIRGIRRPETLTVEPAQCLRPALDCDVVLSGAVRRSDYEMDSLKLAINDRVVFLLHARLEPPGDTP